MPICVFIVSDVSILNFLGTFLNVVTRLALLVLDLVLYLCVLNIFILMSLFAIISLLGSHEAAFLVYPLFFLQFSFLAIFQFFVELDDIES